MKKIFGFFKGVKKETKATKWVKGKELIKYSVITLLMVLFFGGFFFGLDVLFSFLKGLVA